MAEERRRRLPGLAGRVVVSVALNLLPPEAAVFHAADGAALGTGRDSNGRLLHPQPFVLFVARVSLQELAAVGPLRPRDE